MTATKDSYLVQYVTERAQLDYSYFPHYDHDLVKSKLHDKIVTDLLKTALKNDEWKETPWLTYMCGAYGSGKSHTVRTLWPSSGFVYIDPDAIKLFLPTTTDLKALHLEATFVALLAERVVINLGLSAIIDGSLHDHEWYAVYLKQLRIKHPEYNLSVVKVECDLPTVLKRCVDRALVTKRVIPEELIRRVYDKLHVSFPILKPMFDCIVFVDNNIVPKVTDIQLRKTVEKEKIRKFSHPPFLDSQF